MQPRKRGVARFSCPGSASDFAGSSTATAAEVSHWLARPAVPARGPAAGLSVVAGLLDG